LPTQKDIARALSVSVMTVSKALSNAPDISPETRARVLAKARELNYRPNLHSRMLRSGRLRNFGFLMPETNPEDKTSAYLVIEFLTGVNDYMLTTSNLLTLVKLPHLERDENQLARILEDQCVDGLIIFFRLPRKTRAVLGGLNIPVVWLDNDIREDTNCIFRDEIDAGYQATRYMIDNGHRDILFPKPAGSRPQHISSPLIEKGYEKAMSEAGLNTRYMPFEPPNLKFAKIARRMLQSPDRPRACVGIGLPLIAYEAGKMGIRVPEDLSLAASGTSRASRGIFTDLTRVTIDRYEMGYAAGDMLSELIKTGKPQPTRIFKGKLEKGGTVATVKENSIPTI